MSWNTVNTPDNQPLNASDVDERENKKQRRCLDKIR